LANTSCRGDYFLAENCSLTQVLNAPNIGINMTESALPSIFTKIINGQIPCYKIYEDEYTFAFLDINPVQIAHTLIVPKIQTDYFVDVPEPFYSKVFQAAQIIAPALTKTTGKNRVLLTVEGFDIPHFHLHLVPANSSKELGEERKSFSHQKFQELQNQILANLPIF
jgi:histidine triad (HIT) family protein